MERMSKERNITLEARRMRSRGISLVVRPTISGKWITQRRVHDHLQGSGVLWVTILDNTVEGGRIPFFGKPGSTTQEIRKRWIREIETHATDYSCRELSCDSNKKIFKSFSWNLKLKIIANFEKRFWSCRCRFHGTLPLIWSFHYQEIFLPNDWSFGDKMLTMMKGNRWF